MTDVGTLPDMVCQDWHHVRSVIVVHQPKEFHVGQRILFAELHKLKGTSKRMAPRWESGQIYKIEDSRLFIELL